MSAKRQIVVAYPDGRYTVRTYEGRSLVREVPASMRDVAQATIHGDVVDVRELGPTRLVDIPELTEER